MYKRQVREWPEEENQAQAGEDVWLTLDAPLQEYAVELFEEDSGGVAVIDCMTGELRTLLSMPTFDGNMFVSGMSQSQYDELRNNPKRPEFNKVLSGRYPPASTFKMSVMLAALEHGINPSERILCTGRVEVGNRRFHCWLPRGHGPMNLKDSLQYSCDVYYYEMAQRIGMEKVEAFAKRLGLGQSYDLGVAGVSSGRVPTPEGVKQRFGHSWRLGDSLNAFIGQGFVEATPLQLAVMAARIANGKKAILPQLIIGENLPEFEELNIDERHLGIVQRAMRSVCEEPGGTAYSPMALGVRGMEIAGKTGTGQVRNITASERASGVLRNQELAWKYRDHSIFVGYAPFHMPRFAVGTIVEHGGSGAGRAAAITRALLKRALERDGLLKTMETEG